MQEGELEGIYMRAYTSYLVQTKPKRKKKVAGKREVRMIAYTSKHKKQKSDTLQNRRRNINKTFSLS